MLYIQKCSYNICSHTCSNSELCNVVIVHRAQGNSRTIGNFWSIVLYVQTLSEICNNILVKFIDIPTSVMAYHEHCILVQQKVDILVAFTNSVPHRSGRSEFMSPTSKLVFLDISIVTIFIQFVYPRLFSILTWCRGILSWGNTVLLPVTVVVPIGYGGLAPMHTWRLAMLCLYFLWSNLEKLFGLTYIHPYPKHIVAA